MYTDEAWEGFNLGEHNQDPGGSWLYAIRYGEENLREHQDAVIIAIQHMGVEMIQLPDGRLGMCSERDLPEDEVRRLGILAEELTVTNEALELANLELHGKSVAELADIYELTFYAALKSGHKEQAAGILRIEIPQLVSDLMVAQADNEPLSEREYQAVIELGNFATARTAILMKGYAIVSTSTHAPTQILTKDDLPSY